MWRGAVNTGRYIGRVIAALAEDACCTTAAGGGAGRGGM